MWPSHQEHAQCQTSVISYFHLSMLDLMGVILVMTCCTVSRSYCFTAYLDGPMHTNILIFIMFYVFMYALYILCFFYRRAKDIHFTF